MAEEGTVAFPPLTSGAALCGLSVEREQRISLNSLSPQDVHWRAPRVDPGLQAQGKGRKKEPPEMASFLF